MPVLGGEVIGYGYGDAGGISGEPFSGTLDSGGEATVTGLTSANTKTPLITVTSDPAERGDIRVVGSSSTTLTLRSDAGSKHSGVTFKGILI